MLRRGVAALIVLLAGMVAASPPAGAHPFLVRTDPADGARLTRAPQSVSLQFSEALGDTAPELTLSRSGGGRGQALGPVVTSGGRIVRADVAVGRGIHELHWRVVADDGHLSEGSFAFAVGPVEGTLPASSARTRPASPVRAAAAWLFFAGVALVLGAVGTAVAVDRDRHARTKPLAVGLVIAEVGAILSWASSVAGVGGPAGTARQRGLLAVVAASVSLAALARRRPPVAGLLIIASGIAWAARGQVGVQNGVVGTLLDAAHLLGSASWAGALLLLVADLWRSRGAPAALAARARRYAGVVVVPVAVLAVAGIVSAVLMVPDMTDLWQTTYGRLLLAKTALFAVALALARRARRRGLAPDGLVSLRRLTRIEVAVVAGVLAVAAVLGNTAPPAPAVTAVSLLGPPPLAGPVVRDAGLAGILTVAVAVGDGQLQVEVLVPGGDAAGARAEVAVTGRSEPGRFESCGDGCLSAPWRPPPGETTVRVVASAPGWRGGSFATTVDWPPAQEDPALLERVLTATRAEPEVEMVERTSSGPDSVVTPMTYRTGGAELVDEAPYASGGAEDVRPLPGGDGLRLYLPGDRLWVTMWLDEAGRIARERIINVGLQIDHVYRYG